MPEFVEPLKLVPIREPTARQMQVVERLARGLTYREIALELGIATRTVKMHVRDVAMLLPNPHSLPAARLVVSWAAARAA